MASNIFLSSIDDNKIDHVVKKQKCDNTELKFVVTIQSSSDAFELVQRFLSELYIEQNKYCLVSEGKSINALSVTYGDNPIVRYAIPEHTDIHVNYDGTIVMCRINKISKDHGTYGTIKC